jgi:hypothetical protein
VSTGSWTGDALGPPWTGAGDDGAVWGVLGRPILEKKRKENRNRLGCQGLLGQNEIGPPEENKNCF